MGNPVGRPADKHRALRILYYVEGLDIGGANQTTVTTAVAMHRRGHHVFFASRDGPLKDRLLTEGIRHVPIETGGNHPSRRAARVLGEVIDREKVQVVCPNGYDCLMDALWAALWRGIPVVPTFGGMLNPEYYHPRVPKAIAFSGEFRDALIRRYGWKRDSLDLLINRIDTERFRPDLDRAPFRTRWGLEETTPVVLMACRHDSLKIQGVHFLLDSVGGLARQLPDVRIVLAGRGEHSPEVDTRVSEINREEGCDRVILVGKLLDMESAYAAADVVVGNGARSGLEGLACGKPVVSVGDSGLAGVFTPETIEHFAYYNFDKGRVFDGTTQRKPDALVETLSSLLRDERRRERLGEFGRTYALRSLSVEAGIERLEEILLDAKRRSLAQRAGDAWEFARGVVSFTMFRGRRRVGRIFPGAVGSDGVSEAAAGQGGFLKNSATTFLTSVFALCVGTVQAAVVARALHPEGKGALASVLLLPQLLATLSPLGINWAATYHLGRGTYDRETLVRTVLTALLALGGLGMAVCLGIGYLMRGTLLQGIPAAAFLIAVLTIPTQICLLFLGGLFRGEMRIAEANRMDASRTALMFLCILVALLALDLGVEGVVLGQLVAELLVVALAIRRFGVATPRPLLRWGVLRSLMNYGLRVYSFAIFLFLNYRFDLFLVRYYLKDLRQIGLYSTAVSLAEILWMVPTAMGTVLFPSIARSRGGDRDQLTLAVCRNTFWIMLGLCGVLALARRPALELFFGERFLPAAPALLAILPGIFAMSIQVVLGTDLSGRGHPLPVTLGSVLGFAVNVALNVVWIRRYGIVGASLASSVSYSIVALVVTVAFFRMTGARARDAFLLRREDLSRVAGLFLRAKEAVV